MRRQLIDAVKSICQLDCGEQASNSEFNELLREIQDILGQDDGGPAGMFFDDAIVSVWESASPSERMEIMRKYISIELQYVLFD